MVLPVNLHALSQSIKQPSFNMFVLGVGFDRHPAFSHSSTTSAAFFWLTFMAGLFLGVTDLGRVRVSGFRRLGVDAGPRPKVSLRLLFLHVEHRQPLDRAIGAV